MASDVSLKDEIAAALTGVLRDLQKRHATEEDVIKTESEHATKLCIVLEAVFLHGLKKKVLLRKRAGSTLSKSDMKKSLPMPSVWPLFSACTPKDVVSQLSRLAYVTTEIGQCRAWIRLALNDGIMESYVDAMLIDKSLMNSWYTDGAFLMDAEQSFSLKTLLQGLSAFQFDLAFDSRDVNTWPIETLQLSGLRGPDEDFAIVQAPTSDATAYDPMASFSTLGAALRAKDSTTTAVTMATIEDPIEETGQTSRSPKKKKKKKRRKETSQSVVKETETPDRPATLDLGDEKEKELLANVVAASVTIPSKRYKRRNLSPIKSRSYSDAPMSLSRRLSDELFVPSHLNTSDVSAGTPPVDDAYSSLFGKYRPKQWRRKSLMANVELPSDIDDLSYDGVTRAPRRSLPAVLSPEESDEGNNVAESMGFEIITSSSPSPLVESLSTETKLSLLTVLTRERGLDSQQFQCRGCSTPIGMIFGHARVCKFDGRYYCKDCHKEEESLIPARLIYNWDFNKYKVSRSSKEFIDSIAEDPRLNLAKANPTLYQHVSQLNDVRSLRIQLRAATTYLFTCQSNMWEQFRTKVWGREYLFENPDLFSLSDFLQVQSGSMIVYLKKIVAAGVKHVYRCKFCSQKGHICEICNNPKIIYSFEVHTVVQCDVCQAVFHKACKADLSCTKCARIRERRTRAETRDQNRSAAVDEESTKIV